MFKKFLYVFASLLIALCVVSCGPKGDTPKDEDKDTPKIDPTTYTYPTPQTDALKLTEDYEGKDFVEDGIGVCTVVQYVDGDTTQFRSKNGNVVSLRYNGVNTPESTYKVEPWGFAASRFTKSKLSQAHKIVLAAEKDSPRTDNNGRFLGWVWIIDKDGDSRLLNLEICEVALGFFKPNDYAYDDIFTKSVYDVTIGRCRIYGQKDELYDYSTEAKAMSLKDLRETYGTPEATLAQTDKGKKVVISGVVARMNGTASCYIQQYDETSNEYYGIYVYGGFSPIGKFAVGNSVVVEGTIGYHFGSLQLTGVTEKSVKLRSWADKTDPEKDVQKLEVEASTITTENTKLFGSLVTVKNLTITGGRTSMGTSGDGTQKPNNAFTINCAYVVDGKTQRLDIRVDSNILIKAPDGTRINTWELFNQYYGELTISSLTAIVAYYDASDNEKYDGYIQLMLCNINDITFNN